ncbi:MAG: UDP-N-acetylmuramate--L-alanine ligase [Acidobacteriota bacterium]
MTAQSLDIYLVAIGGTGMAPLACLLKDLGHRVRGVDGPLYPPMSDVLKEAGLEPLVGYDPAHLEAQPRPDLVVIGNAVPRTNPEAEAAERLGLECLSMPQALGRFLLEGRRPLVAAGTHGKTTTTSMASWVYDACGRDPGFLIGGVSRDLGVSFRVGSGDRFVVEGDEYNAAYFDRGPKFLHYRPETLILTSVEHDHADLYPSHGDLLSAFRHLVRLLPATGLLAAYGDSPDVVEVAREARSRVVHYGFDPGHDVVAVRPSDVSGNTVEVHDRLDGELQVHRLELAVPGDHNILNALGVWAAARVDGIPPVEIARAFSSFKGAKRRLEVLGTVDGTTVVDDFAHHPTAVSASLGALRDRYPKARIVSLFEPRSLTAGRAFFFEAYVDAFSKADAVLLAPIHYRERLSDDEALDLEGLCLRLRDRGIDAEIADSTDDVLRRAADSARPDDVLVTMSSGSFDGLPRRLVEALSARSS